MHLRAVARQARLERIEGVFDLVSFLVGNAAIHGVVNGVAHQNPNAGVFQVLIHLLHVDGHLAVFVCIPVRFEQFFLCVAQFGRFVPMKFQGGAQLSLESAGHFVRHVLAEVQMNVKRRLRLLLGTFAGNGKFVVVPHDRHGYGVLLEIADAVVPVQQRRVVLVNDVGYGAVEVAAGVADEAHVVAQHVVPVGIRAVPLVHHQRYLAEVDVGDGQLCERVADRTDVRDVAAEVAEIERDSRFLVHQEEHVRLGRADQVLVLAIGDGGNVFRVGSDGGGVQRPETMFLQLFGSLPAPFFLQDLEETNRPVSGDLAEKATDGAAGSATRVRQPRAFSKLFEIAERGIFLQDKEKRQREQPKIGPVLGKDSRQSSLQRRVLEHFEESPGGAGMQFHHALWPNQIVVLVDRLEFETTAFIPKYSKMLQRRVFGDESLIKENLPLVFVVLVGNELADALRVAFATDGAAVDPVIFVREDVLVLTGAVDDEAWEFWGGIGSHGKRPLVTLIYVTSLTLK